MTVGKTYKVTKRIKIHTKPLIMVEVIKTGVFLKETASNYWFDDFRVGKSTVINIEEQGDEE